VLTAVAGKAEGARLKLYFVDVLVVLEFKFVEVDDHFFFRFLFMFGLVGFYSQF
jgi:hypothetical protein